MYQALCIRFPFRTAQPPTQSMISLHLMKKGELHLELLSIIIYQIYVHTILISFFLILFSSSASLHWAIYRTEGMTSGREDLKHAMFYVLRDIYCDKLGSAQ